MQRRRFCELIGEAAALGLVSPTVASAGAGAKRLLLSPQNPPCQLGIGGFDLDSNEFFEIALDFEAHIVMQHPIEKHLAVAFPQYPGGTRAALLDLKNRKVIEHIPALPGSIFYGHGVFSDDGKLMYSSELDPKDSRGIVSIRDFKSGKYLGNFPTFGTGPHDLKIIRNGSAMLIVNSGFIDEAYKEKIRPENEVVCVDIKAQKELWRYEPPKVRQFIQHVAMNDKEEVAIGFVNVGDESLVNVAIRKKDGTATFPAETATPAEIYGKYAFGLAISPNGEILGTAHPDGIVNLWEMASGKLIKTIKCVMPHGIVAVNAPTDCFIVTYNNGSIGKIDLRTFELVELRGNSPPILNYKHLTLAVL
jgi:hypothetical protein